MLQLWTAWTYESSLFPSSIISTSAMSAQPAPSSPLEHSRTRVAECTQLRWTTAADRVVADIILISGIRTHTLFDTGTSHSFVNRAFASLYGLELGPLLYAREVQIPDHVLHVAECCWACPVQLGPWIMLADLLVLGQLQDFDVVLGMDWLARYYATIDYGARTVTFHEPGQEEFTYKGCRSTFILKNFVFVAGLLRS
uniref:Uncharacterized protein n=1 Tax=Ananas comosus var. bracteatus TaxID=296719 RepID=A0A6V7P5H6_ANACO|nr:unnamed protein product [Ananas comosus var. bracteatus]